MSENRSSNNFKCPKCGGTQGYKVTDSRGCETWIRRRRECISCGHRFTTRETVWNDDLEDDKTMKREEALNLRTLALEIVRRTDHLVPNKNPEAVTPPGGR